MNKHKGGIKEKKESLRRCVACRNMLEKTELLRIVRYNGNFEIDKTFKKNGRGAYICKNANCLKIAIKRKSLENSFKSKVSQEIYEHIEVLLNE